MSLCRRFRIRQSRITQARVLMRINRAFTGRRTAISVERGWAPCVYRPRPRRRLLSRSLHPKARGFRRRPSAEWSARWKVCEERHDRRRRAPIQEPQDNLARGLRSPRSRRQTSHGVRHDLQHPLDDQTADGRAVQMLADQGKTAPGRPRGEIPARIRQREIEGHHDRATPATPERIASLTIPILMVRLMRTPTCKPRRRPSGKTGHNSSRGKSSGTQTPAATPRRPSSNGSAARRSTASSRSGSCSRWGWPIRSISRRPTVRLPVTRVLLPRAADVKARTLLLGRVVGLREIERIGHPQRLQDPLRDEAVDRRAADPFDDGRRGVAAGV